MDKIWPDVDPVDENMATLKGMYIAIESFRAAMAARPPPLDLRLTAEQMRTPFDI